MVYLYGGYDGTLPKIEEALDGPSPAMRRSIQLESQDAFGEYDPELVKIEERNRFPSHSKSACSSKECPRIARTNSTRLSTR